MKLPAIDILLTKRTNTIAANVTKNLDSKKVRDCYILHTVLSAIISLAIICYHYAKQKDNDALTKKWK